jgi:hypothetical protein
VEIVNKEVVGHLDQEAIRKPQRGKETNPIPPDVCVLESKVFRRASPPLKEFNIKNFNFAV